MAIQREQLVVRYRIDEAVEITANWEPAVSGRSQGWMLRPSLDHRENRHYAEYLWQVLVGVGELFVPGDNDSPPDSAVKRLVRALKEHRSAVDSADAALGDVVRSLITPDEGVNEGEPA